MLLTRILILILPKNLLEKNLNLFSTTYIPVIWKLKNLLKIFYKKTGYFVRFTAQQDIVPKKIKYSEYLQILEKENKEEDDLF